MALNSKRPTASAIPGGKKPTVSRLGEARSADAPVTKKAFAKRRKVAPVETIEARLERKAVVADAKTFAATSLGQMTREQRHKLLYGD